jgi:mono/diheme cytochrome c family protein
MGGVAPTPDRRPSRWITADPSVGQRIFETTCSGCHGPDGGGGDGPALNNPVLLQNATDTYLVETIARGRQGTTMDGFLEPSVVRPALTRAEIEAVVSHIRTWGAPSGANARLRRSDEPSVSTGSVTKPHWSIP